MYALPNWFWIPVFSVNFIEYIYSSLSLPNWQHIQKIVKHNATGNEVIDAMKYNGLVIMAFIENT